MKDIFKRISVILLVFSFAAVSLNASSPSFTKGQFDTKLDVYWNLDPAQELFRVGFSSVAPASGTNQGWIRIPDTTSINMVDWMQNNAISHKASGTVYAYWNIYSNNAFLIELSASGPLANNAVAATSNYNNLINWTASWQPMEVNSLGKVVESNLGKLKIGRDDNVFNGITVATGNGYTGAVSDYTEPKELFRQEAGNYPLKSKYGFAKIDIETQNTKASDIADGYEKVRGNYSCTLMLDVIAK